MTTCVKNGQFQNLGRQKFDFNLGQPAGGFISPDKKTISYADALLEDTFTNFANKVSGDGLFSLNIGNLYDFGFEAAEVALQEGNTGVSKKTIDPKMALVGSFASICPTSHARLKSFDGTEVNFMLITKNEYIVAADDGANIVSVPVYMIVGEQYQSEASPEAVWITPFRLEYRNRTGNFAKAINPYNDAAISWRPTAWQGIKPVSLTEVSSATSAIVVDAVEIVGGADVSELVTGDFLLVDSTGTEYTDYTAAQVNGRYTLTPASAFPADTYKLSLKEQPLATTQGYETDGTIEIVIS